MELLSVIHRIGALRRGWLLPGGQARGGTVRYQAGSPDGAQRNPGPETQRPMSPGFRCAPSGLRLLERQEAVIEASARR
jgi:hypothetical protein